MKELKFLQTRCAPPNPFLINFFDSKVVDEGNQRHTFYILIEYGPNGTLFDLMGTYLNQKKRFSEEEIVNLLRVVTDDLLELHQHGIVHCDIKIENLLFFNWQVVKLCDFGSISKLNIDTSKLAKSDFYTYESKFEKQTTLMYRPPEMCDLYLGFKINTQVDMWMLGCVAFTLMFFKHPFHESSKLSIVNASFFWPDDSKYSEKLENLVRNLITPNPDFRPTAAELKEVLANWEQITKIDLNPLAQAIRQESLAKKQINFGNASFGARPVRPGSREAHTRPQNQGDPFDFSGLDKWSKNPAPSRPKPKLPIPTKPAQSDKFGNFNFMNFNFGGPSQPQGHSFPQQRSQSPIGNKNVGFSGNPGTATNLSQPGSQHFPSGHPSFHPNTMPNLPDPFQQVESGSRSPMGVPPPAFMSIDQKSKDLTKESQQISAFDHFVAGVSVAIDTNFPDTVPSTVPGETENSPLYSANSGNPSFQFNPQAQPISPHHTPTTHSPHSLPGSIQTNDFDIFLINPAQNLATLPPEPPKTDLFDPFNIDFSKAPQ
jgi:serine/threonine protein kinase